MAGQTCHNIGQTPESAFPVCGNDPFTQNSVPVCGQTNIPVPCNDPNAYQNRNPYWYKFTCYVAGSLGFVITPSDLTDDYDWQLFDITGHNPSDVFTVPSLFVACNWSGEPGETGASSDGLSLVNCGGLNVPLFSSMPVLIASHEYLLLVSHFTNSQSGYSIVFVGGSAGITDGKEPLLQNARTSCDGTQLIVQINKNIKCNTIAADGSDFTLGSSINIISASSLDCNSTFDTDEIILSLSTPLTPGTFTLTIQNGSDGNTLLDNCNRPINAGGNLSFTVAPLLPTPFDSVRTVGCAPDKVFLVFKRPIQCSSIAGNGSDFTVTGPQAIPVTGVTVICNSNGATRQISLQLASSLVVGGTYQVHLQNGSDGNTIVDECGRATPAGTLFFPVSDTVSADFTYAMRAGCKNDTLTFIHDGRNGVNSWNWNFDNTITTTQQNFVQVYSSSSQHTVKLIVSNGVCKDTVSRNIILNNKVVADFETGNTICPQDAAVFINNSTGAVDNWLWSFGNGGTSSVKDPSPQSYPPSGRETVYTIKLIASSNSFDCRDSVSRTIRVLGNCFIAVPTAFTPNGDGLNDNLYPLNALKADHLEFRVYNRFGQLVFESRDWTKKWDGRLNGEQQPTGVYAWFLRFTHHDTGKKIFMKGTTVLIR
jgi:gliding motility-associated-like protein